jgi:serine protease Do
MASGLPHATAMKPRLRCVTTIIACVALHPARGICQEPRRHGGGAAPANLLAQLDESLERLASKVAPAVVQIEATGFGPAEDEERKTAAVIVRQHGVGAGVIVDADGYIMTNAHVVERAQRVRVTLSLTGKFQRVDAKLIGVERQADLALLKIDAHGLPTLPFNLNPPRPGEVVVAIGSPSGLQNSVTMGVISSAWRQPDPDNPMVYLQTDAPINRGNSGGPLVDVSGAVVGLNTFIISSSGGSEGLGFAFPAPVIDFVYHSLREYGRVDHVDIGIVAQTVTPAIAEGLAQPQDRGVLIADLQPHGPADLAGIEVGDIVLTVDGYTIQGVTEFTAVLYQHPPQAPLKVDVLRRGETLSFRVAALVVRDTLDQLADAPDPVKSHIEPLDILAMDLDDALRSVMPAVRSAAGVVVVGRARGFNAVETGLQPGDVVASVNRTLVLSVPQLRAAVAELKRGDAVVLYVERLGRFRYLTFEME